MQGARGLHIGLGGRVALEAHPQAARVFTSLSSEPTCSCADDNLGAMEASMATKRKAKGAKKTAKMESSKGARDSRREVPLPRPKEGSKLAREIAKLAKLTKSELWKRHEEVFGHKARSCNTKQLVDVIARRLVEQASEKGKPAAIESSEAVSSAPTTSSSERDPRMPKAGTVLEREHNGKVHKVKVLEDGFEYEGRKYRSLSGLAKEITGAIWNGWVWFGLVKRPTPKAEANDAA